MNSKEIASYFNKKHHHVLRDIENLISRNPEFQIEFNEHFYIDSMNRKQREYLISDTGRDVLINKYKYNVRSARFEYKFYNMIKDLFPNEEIITQMTVLNYKIDFYLPFANIIIEYDENQHRYYKERDAKRMDEVCCEIMRKKLFGEPLYEGEESESTPLYKEKDTLSVIRVQEGEEMKAIREILLTMHGKSYDPMIYMK